MTGPVLPLLSQNSPLHCAAAASHCAIAAVPKPRLQSTSTFPPSTPPCSSRTLCHHGRVTVSHCTIAATPQPHLHATSALYPMPTHLTRNQANRCALPCCSAPIHLRAWPHCRSPTRRRAPTHRCAPSRRHTLPRCRDLPCHHHSARHRALTHGRSAPPPLSAPPPHSALLPRCRDHLRRLARSHRVDVSPSISVRSWITMRFLTCSCPQPCRGWVQWSCACQ